MMNRAYYLFTDKNLSQEQLERGDFSTNFIDWRIFKIKRDGSLVKKPILATVDAKLRRDSYTPDEVINAMLSCLSKKYDQHDIAQVKSRGFLTYPSWHSPLFMNERPKEIPDLVLDDSSLLLADS